jgi:hypothetical protein
MAGFCLGAGAELVTLDSQCCAIFFDANNPARGYELQEASAVQAGGPVHGKLDDAADRQTLLGCEQDAAAAYVQGFTHSRGHDIAVPEFVAGFLLQRETFCPPTFWKKYDIRASVK